MSVHQPILVETIIQTLTENLSLFQGECWIVDCTFGGGGHTRALLDELKHRHFTSIRILGLDQDSRAIENARIYFRPELDQGLLELQHRPFSELAEAAQGRKIVGILADLGFSSDQVEDPVRGLSFQIEGPLDMRMNPSPDRPTCFEVLSQTGEKELAHILFEYGEERFSRRIAGAIIRARSRGELPRTTTALADLIARAMPGPRGRIHPATRSFQGLRIFINQELEELDSLLNHGTLLLRPKGRVAILSFHSLEDRRVKKTFHPRTGSTGLKSLTKKPICADEEELRTNPRARSAKLRIAERVE